MDITEKIREDMTMAGNTKKTENKTWDDSTETEKLEITISKKDLNHRRINLIQNIRK